MLDHSTQDVFCRGSIDSHRPNVNHSLQPRTHVPSCTAVYPVYFILYCNPELPNHLHHRFELLWFAVSFAVIQNELNNTGKSSSLWPHSEMSRKQKCIDRPATVSSYSLSWRTSGLTALLILFLFLSKRFSVISSTSGVWMNLLDRSWSCIFWHLRSEGWWGTVPNIAKRHCVPVCIQCEILRVATKALDEWVL